MGAGVHAQATGTTAETVAFGSKFAGVAVFAEELTLVLGAVGGVQHLAAETCKSGQCREKHPSKSKEKFKKYFGRFFVVLPLAGFYEVREE